MSSCSPKNVLPKYPSQQYNLKDSYEHPSGKLFQPGIETTCSSFHSQSVPPWLMKPDHTEAKCSCTRIVNSITKARAKQMVPGAKYTAVREGTNA